MSQENDHRGSDRILIFDEVSPFYGGKPRQIPPAVVPMRHLTKFVEYMKSKPGVWFATGDPIARYVNSAK